MRKVIGLLVAMLLGVIPGFAAFSKNDAGTSAAQFLKLGAGARAAGMGEAFSAVTTDADSIYWNPAGLNNVVKRSISVMHTAWLEDTTYDWFSYAQNFGKPGVFGLGVQYLSYGSITEYNTTGLETGSFNPSDLAVSFAYANKCKGFDLGANIKYISLKIKENATAYAADFGVQHNLMNDRATLGLAVQNLGTKIKFIDSEDSLPVNIKLGGEYLIKANWLASLDINAPVDNEISFGAGTEYKQKVGEKMNVMGRLGYNTSNKDTGALNGATFGLGMSYLDYGVDYAFVPYGDLGNTQRISLSIKF